MFPFDDVIMIAWNKDLWLFRRQAIILTNDGVSPFGSLGTNFGENENKKQKKAQQIAFTEMNLKMSLSKWRSPLVDLYV